MSENWVAHNIYCPICGNPHISNLDNNMPVADFSCTYCGEIFELKSKCGNIGNKIADGAYFTMIERITSSNNPNLFFNVNILKTLSFTLFSISLFSKYKSFK